MYDCYISCLRQVLWVWTWGLFPAKRPRAVLIHFMIEWKADSTGVESSGFPSDIPGFKSWPCPFQVTWPLTSHFIFLPLHFLTWKCGINACLLEFTWRLKGSVYVPSRRSLAWEAHVSAWLVLLDKFPGCRDQTEHSLWPMPSKMSDLSGRGGHAQGTWAKDEEEVVVTRPLETCDGSDGCELYTEAWGSQGRHCTRAGLGWHDRDHLILLGVEEGYLCASY